MLFLVHAITSLLLIQGTVTTRAAAPAPIVNIGYAKYQGEIVQDQISSATHTRFLGICFAAPPTGGSMSNTITVIEVYLLVCRHYTVQRARLPAPVSEIQQSAPAPVCFQASLGTGASNPYGGVQPLFQMREDDGPKISEDCLFLK